MLACGNLSIVYKALTNQLVYDQPGVDMHLNLFGGTFFFQKEGDSAGFKEGHDPAPPQVIILDPRSRQLSSSLTHRESC